MVIPRVCEETVYGTVINGLCKSGNTFKAIELFCPVDEEGSCKPNSVMYNTIIDCLGKDMKVDAEMATNATPPDIFTYNSVIQGLCNFSRCTEAQNGLEQCFCPTMLPIMGTGKTELSAFQILSNLGSIEDELELSNEKFLHKTEERLKLNSLLVQAGKKLKSRMK